ncbi:MAG TPA: hypothetical protein VIJ65_05415, partial [Acidobacteriaceae bacterium]
MLRRCFASAALPVFVLCAAACGAQTVTAFGGTTAVGQSSTPLTVTVTMTAIGQPGDPLAVTQGVPAIDFSLTGGTCTLDLPVTTIGQTCTATIVFTPKYPGVRSGAVLIETTDGRTLLGSVPVVGMATGSLAVLDPGEIDTA